MAMRNPFKKNKRLVDFRNKIRAKWKKIEKLEDKITDLRIEIMCGMETYRERLEKNPWHKKRSLAQRIPRLKVKIDSMLIRCPGNPKILELQEELADMQTQMDAIKILEAEYLIDQMLRS